MEIIPFRFVGPLAFGDARKDARAKLNARPSTFTKVRGQNETEAFDEIGLHLDFDEEGRLDFVEAFSPADISFRGIRILDRDVSAVAQDMNRLGLQDVRTDVGAKFPEAGIAVYAPSGVVEGVAAHRMGYYD